MRKILTAITSLILICLLTVACGEKGSKPDNISVHLEEVVTKTRNELAEMVNYKK